VRRITLLSLAPGVRCLEIDGLLARARGLAAEAARLDEPDFLACGFAFIGAWGRRTAGSRL
jgi:hypothetical protein